MAKGRLVALVVSQELLEELVLLRRESVDESEYLATCMFWSCLRLYQARNLSHIKVLKIVV